MVTVQCSLFCDWISDQRSGSRSVACSVLSDNSVGSLVWGRWLKALARCVSVHGRRSSVANDNCTGVTVVLLRTHSLCFALSPGRPTGLNHSCKQAAGTCACVRACTALVCSDCFLPSAHLDYVITYLSSCCLPLTHYCSSLPIDRLSYTMTV